MRHYLHLNVSSGKSCPPEHRWATDNDRTRLLTRRHVLNELLYAFVDTGILIGRNDEGVAFLLEDCSSTLDCGVDQGYYLEARTKFTEGECTWNG
jgi:hypothetical protein